MKKLLLLLFLSLFVSITLQAQERAVLRANGQLIKGSISEALIDGNEVRAIDKTQMKAAKDFFMDHNDLTDTDVILFYEFPNQGLTNFGQYGQDRMVQWFEAPADMIIRRAGVNTYANPEETVAELKLVKFAWTKDQILNVGVERLGWYEAAGNGFNDITAYMDNFDVTGGWVDIEGNAPTSPFGGDLWSDNGYGAPFTPLQSGTGFVNTFEWIDMDLLVEPEVLQGEIIGISVKNLSTTLYSGVDIDRLGFWAYNGLGIPGFKFYANGRFTYGGPGVGDCGWWSREYTWDFALDVTLTGDAPPVIEDVTDLGVALSTNPRDVFATITDENHSGGPSGVASASLWYSVNGAGFIEVPMTNTNGDDYWAQIPGANPGDVIDYYVSAEDVMGNTSETFWFNYFIFLPQHDYLIIANGWNYPGYPTNYYMGPTIFGQGYPAANFDVWTYRPVDEDLLNNYLFVFEFFNGGGQDYHKDAVRNWLAGNSNRAYFLAGMEWLGVINGYVDVDYFPGEFEYDILGISHSYNDVSYNGSNGQELPSAIQLIGGQVLNNALLSAGAENLQHNPNYEIGLPNWMDAFEPVPAREANVFLTTETRGIEGSPDVQILPCGITNITPYGNKVVFLSLDPISINSDPDGDHGDNYIWWGYTDENYPYQALQWFLDNLTQDPYLTLNFPNEEMMLSAGREYDIKWTSFQVDNIDIEYTTDYSSKAAWIPIETNYNAASGSYAWTVPAVNSNDCKIRITNSDNPGMTSESNEIFFISSGGEKAESEDNNTAPNANWIAVGDSVVALISTGDDVDYYKFYAEAGDTITVFQSDLYNSDLWGRIILYNSSGSWIMSSYRYPTANAYNSSAISYIIPSIGIYYLRVANIYNNNGFPNNPQADIDPTNRTAEEYYREKFLERENDKKKKTGGNNITADTGEYYLTLSSYRALAPSINHSNIYNIYSNSAFGEVDFNNYLQQSQVQLHYGTTQSMNQTIDLGEYQGSLDSYYSTVCLQELTPASNYYYQFEISNSAGTIYSPVGMFTTPPEAKGWVAVHGDGCNWGPSFAKIDTWNSNNAIAVGGAILKTSDGGLNWYEPFLNPYNPWNNRDIIMQDDQVGYLLKYYGVYKTEDGGESWNLILEDYNLNLRSIDVNSSGRVIAAGAYKIIYSDDARSTWTYRDSPGNYIYDISFSKADPNNIIAVGDGGAVYKSTDAGDSWSVPTQPGTGWELISVSYISESAIYAASFGGSLYKSTDGCDSWTSWGTNLMYTDAMYFIDESTGFVSGNEFDWDLALHKTTDGGETWTPELIGTSNAIYGIDFSDNNNGFICGDFGTILKTVNYHYADYPMGGDIYNIVVQNAMIQGSPLSFGDEIGIFDEGPGGIGLVGAYKYLELPAKAPIVVPSYLETTVGNTTLPGAIPGNPITIKIWDDSEGIEYETEVIFSSGGYFGDGFATNVQSVNGIPLVSLNLNLPAGTISQISLPVEPFDYNVPEVFGGFSPTYMEGNGQTYIPEWGLNQLTMDILHGYKIFDDSEMNLPLYGIPLNGNYAIPIPGNTIQLLGYPYNSESSASAIFGGYPSIQYADDGQGNVYIPEWGINDMPMYPGRGYRVLSDEDITPFNWYPMGPLNKSNKKLIDKSKLTHKGELQFKKTGLSYAVIINEIDDSQNILGDQFELGAFYEGKCVGALIVDKTLNKPQVLITWMGDSRFGVEGPEEDEPITLKALGNNIGVEFIRGGKYGKDVYSVANLSVESNIPTKFELSNNYPNPFNPSTIIKYAVPNESKVSLRVFNLLGEQVALLVDKNHSPGYYEINFEASHLSSGIYFYQIVADGFIDVKKMILLK